MSFNPPKIKRCIDFGVYVVVRVLISTVQSLRMETCHALAGGLAILFCDVLKVRRRVIDENLCHAYPQLNDTDRHTLARQMWEHLFLMVAEVAQVRRKIHASNWHKYVQIPQGPETARLLLDDRPTIIVSGHFGNFEIAGYLLGLFGFPTYTVARPLDNPYLHRFVNRFRAVTGQYMLPKNGSAKQIALLLERGAVLTLLGDQHAGDSGCWVNFFGRPASTHKAIAIFSLVGGAPMLVSCSRRLGKPLLYESSVEALADPADPEIQSKTVPELTQWYTDHLEAMINRAPEQYWWLHRRWKGQPAQARRRKKRRGPKQAA